MDEDMNMDSGVGPGLQPAFVEQQQQQQNINAGYQGAVDPGRKQLYVSLYLLKHALMTRSQRI